MKTTADLLNNALSKNPAPYWTKKLKLARTTLATAKVRGRLSPAIAGALAEELGEDAAAWMVIAALEGERDSACKTRMIKKFIAGSALALGSESALAAPTVSIQEQNLCIMSNERNRRRITRKCSAQKAKTRPTMAGFFVGV